MSSDIAPLLIGFAAVGLLLIPIGMIFVARRLVERWRLRARRGGARGSEGWTNRDWVYGPRTPRPARTEAKPLTAAEPHDEPPARENAADLWSSHTAADEDEREARDALERARLEAEEIVATARKERTRILTDLTRECAAVEEARGALATFLAGVLEEIENAPAAGRPAATVHPLSDARSVRASTHGDT
jgi:hypothetical protein